LCAALALLAFVPSGDSFVVSPPPITKNDRGGRVVVLHYGGSNKRKTSSSSWSSGYDGGGYPEGRPATYDLQPDRGLPFIGLLLGRPTDVVVPLLKQTQLQDRKLKVTYDAKKDGWDARTFHKLVDGMGASVVLAKVRGTWIGGYNPRGWASLGGSRPSVASFLFYKKTNPLFVGGGWQKLRVSRSGGMACGKDEYDSGIYFGSDALVMPLNGMRPRMVASRLGYFFECGPENRSTLLPVKGADAIMDELYVISGVYDDGEDVPNSGGVTDLGLY
jgi:hypothetical protein